MSLNKELKKLQNEVLNSYSSEIRKKLIQEDRKLFDSFLEEKVIKKGSKAPDVFFRDKDLNSVYLKELLEESHIVLSFFRGTWCPYCNLELRSLSKINNEIREKGARLIGVSPELYKFVEETVIKDNIEFPLFTDLENKAAEKFGLVFKLPPNYREIYRRLSIHLNVLNGDDNWILPVPATFIISREGIITSAYINADYTSRMEPDDILEELELLS